MWTQEQITKYCRKRQSSTAQGLPRMSNHATQIVSAVQAGQDDDPALEESLGFATLTQGHSKLGWLMNLNEVQLIDFAIQILMIDVISSATQLPVTLSLYLNAVTQLMSCAALCS